MNLIAKVTIICAFFVFPVAVSVRAQSDTTENKKLSRLTVGGYGEAVFSRHFYSDNVFRYSHADRYKEAPAYSRLDLPHAVIMLGYDFGHGWSIGTEIEFEHGGIEAAVEKETEETGEFEQEIERGGEVALEQFWVQKSFGKAFNIRGGHHDVLRIVLLPDDARHCWTYHLSPFTSHLSPCEASSLPGSIFARPRHYHRCPLGQYLVGQLLDVGPQGGLGSHHPHHLHLPAAPLTLRQP